MRKQVLVLGLLFLWVLLVATAIFLFSSQTGEESGEISQGLTDKILDFFGMGAEENSNMHHLIRKGAHMSEYAVLGASVCILFFHIAGMGYFEGCSALRLALYALAAAAIFAATDEIHQAFVPGRGPAVKDVLIDAVGASIGIAAVYWIHRKFFRTEKEN